MSRCQCHGYSGSCSVRTCWRSLNIFSHAAQSLYGRYSAAKEVTFGWLLKSYQFKFESYMARKAKLIPINRFHRASRTQPKLDWLGQMQKQMTRLTQLELNQPNLNRHADSDNTRKKDLVFVKQSVNFCERSAKLPLICDIGSNLNLNVSTTSWPVSHQCSSLCCGRAFRPRTSLLTERCDCQFRFCCSMNCRSECTFNTTEYECIT